MSAFDNSEFENYKNEMREKWGSTEAFSEYEEKTRGYTKDSFHSLAEGMNDIFRKFSLCMKNGNAPDSQEAQSLVKALQSFITENYYTCTNEILAGLGQMYVADARFKESIDKNADGTAEFVCDAVEIYCRQTRN